MSLLINMLPIYLLGNLHCIGMCGPLVMMLGRHPYRYFYFLGRALSFALVAALAGGAGALLYEWLKVYQLPALTSFLFGGFLLTMGLGSFMGWRFPASRWIGKRMAAISQTLSLLLLQERAWPAFLFGFFTVLLPCGQTLVVFSACALFGDLAVGFINGLAFALLTTPSLWVAMHAHRLFTSMRMHYNKIMGVCAFFVGFLAICRGLAEVEIIPHLVLNQHYHLILY